ncbi:MAG: hypothetical protein J6K53_10650 [Roseburia sp.]|nr:hypothetical protein [Roseburia sp.]
MIATKNVAAYINKMGISIKAISNNTGLSQGVLYSSLGTGRERELRADEFLAICIFLDKDPMGFYKESDKEKNAKV